MNKQRILVIEDSNFICTILEEGFREHGFQVSIAHDGKEGLLRAKTEQPDLIVLDLILPEMPGEEVCRRLKKDTLTEKIPVLMLTGKNSDADRVLGRVLGADAYVAKPFTMENLMEEIKKLITLTAFFLVCIFSGVLFAQQNNTDSEVPQGMEIIKVGNTNILIPEGTKVTKKDALLILEPPDQYMARKILVMEEELANLKAQQEMMIQEIKQLKDSLAQLQKTNASP